MAVTQKSTMANIVRTAYDRRLYFALRSQPFYGMLADVKPAAQAMPGDVVTFSTMTDMAVATSTLAETSDVTPVALSNPSQTSVTLAEYGNAVELTAFLRATGFVDVDEAAMELLAWNMVDSLDAVIRDVITAGTNVRYSGNATSRATIDPTDNITADDPRYVVANLRNNKAVPRRGSFYTGFIHPFISHDYRDNTAAGNWRESHVYASPEAIFAAEIGEHEGVVWIETPRARVIEDAGSSPTTTDVYITLIAGQQALAQATAIDPHLVQSPVTDRLRRFLNLGWYALTGWARFREAALYRIESSSSIA